MPDQSAQVCNARVAPLDKQPHFDVLEVYMVVHGWCRVVGEPSRWYGIICLHFLAP